MAYFPLPTLTHAATNYPSPSAQQSLRAGSQNAIVVVTGRIRDGAGDSTSTIWNDPQNRTRRELTIRRQLGDIAGKSTPTRAFIVVLLWLGHEAGALERVGREDRHRVGRTRIRDPHLEISS